MSQTLMEPQTRALVAHAHLATSAQLAQLYLSSALWALTQTGELLGSDGANLYFSFLFIFLFYLLYLPPLLSTTSFASLRCPYAAAPYGSLDTSLDLFEKPHGCLPLARGVGIRDLLLNLHTCQQKACFCLSTGCTSGRSPAAQRAHLAITAALLASRHPQDPAQLGTTASLELPRHRHLVSCPG